MARSGETVDSAYEFLVPAPEGWSYESYRRLIPMLEGVACDVGHIRDSADHLRAVCDRHEWDRVDMLLDAVDTFLAEVGPYGMPGVCVVGTEGTATPEPWHVGAERLCIAD